MKRPLYIIPVWWVFVLVWVPLFTYAQQPIQWPVFRGNPATLPLLINASDTTRPLTAILLTAPAGRLLATSVQPIVSGSGRNRTLMLTGSQTTNLPSRAWLEIRLSGEAYRAGYVTISNQTVNDSPIAINPGVVIGNQSKVVAVANVATGHVFPHGLGTRFITGTVFWDDTGKADSVWRVEAFDDNTAILRGPPGETFTGNIAVTGYKNLTN